MMSDHFQTALPMNGCNRKGASPQHATAPESLFRRTLKPALGLLAAGLALVALAGCQRRGESSAREGSSAELVQEGEVAGQVFVVTRARENVKMALVTVSALSEAQVADVLAKCEAAAPAETAKRQAAFDAALLAVADAKKQLSSAVAAKAKASEAYANAYALELQKRSDSSKGALDAMTSAFVREGAARSSLARKEAFARDAAAALGYSKSSAFLFGFLPDHAQQVAKTDADGRFTIRIPRQGRVALAARASRDVVNSQENYYWLVWVSLSGKNRTDVMLSNDNVTTSGSPESVVAKAE